MQLWPDVELDTVMELAIWIQTWIQIKNEDSQLAAEFGSSYMRLSEIGNPTFG